MDSALAQALRASHPLMKELTALCLLLGLLRAMETVPRETLEGMLETLVEGPHGG